MDRYNVMLKTFIICQQNKESIHVNISKTQKTVIRLEIEGEYAFYLFIYRKCSNQLKLQN